MFLSVILPIYKVEDYLAECLDSLYTQDIPEADYELICVNDGSPDSCGDILRRYAEKHDNLIVIDQENRGVSAARNAGIAAARGDYIWFVDPDDIVAPNYFSVLKSLVEANGVDMLGFAMHQFDEVFSDEEKRSAASHTLECNNKGFVICARLIKKQILDESGLLFDTSLTVAEDTVFITQLDELTHNTKRIDDVIYCYRIRSTSATRTNNDEMRIKKLNSLIAAAEVTLDIYNKQTQKKQSTADSAMYYIWTSLIYIASRKDDVSDEYLRLMRAKKLFPIKRLPESIYKKAYATTRTDIVGKVYDYITTHSNSEFGFRLLKLWYVASDIKDRLQQTMC